MTTGLENTTTATLATRGRLRARVPAAAAALLAGAAVACVGDVTPRGATGGDAGGPLAVSTAQRATVGGFAADTLSAGARILALYPGTGPDSATVAFTFADSARGVGTGLGVLDLRAANGEQRTRLAWPDSVRAVWWSAPHVLSFVATNGRGIVGKVDVAMDTLAVRVDSAGGANVAPVVMPRLPDAAAGRATAFVDSAHQQPAGRPAPRSALRYTVESMVAAPGGRLVALYVAAADSAGRRVNPAWYALALPSGAVASIDSVVGAIEELPVSSGAWGGAEGRTFFYARGLGVYGATVK